METKQLDSEQDLRTSITEALAVAGAIARRAGLPVMESAMTPEGGPAILYVAQFGPWCRAIEAAIQISPGGWTWTMREGIPEAKKLFGEGSRSAAIMMALDEESDDGAIDAGAAWVHAVEGIEYDPIEFGQEAF